MRVLIAEDDATSRVVLQKAVERSGHECLAAGDGLEAWDLFQSTPEVDVLISDWMMPGIDGLELCRRIRRASRPEYTYFIFLTALGDKNHLLMGLEAGADDYLAKPLDREQLQARLISASRVTSLHRELRREIAERKRAEELKAAQVRYAQLRTEVSEILARSGSLQDTLQRCTEAMTRHLNVALARVWTFDEEEGVLELRASAGLYEGTDGLMSRVPIGEKIGRIVQSRRPYVNNDIPNDPHFEGKQWAEREGFIATANYPLIVEDQLVGAIALFAREPLPDHALEAMTSVTDAISQGVKRKQAETELQETEERYRTLVEHIPAVTYVQDIAEPGSNRTSPTMYASPQIEAQSGYPPEAFVEDPELWIKLLHPADRERVLAEDARTDETGEPFRVEYRQLARDGRIVWIRDHAVLVRDEEGNPSYWLGVQHDITERRRAEQALRESELRLRTVITNVPVVLFTLDHTGTFTLSEGKGLEALGLKPGEAVGRSVSELYGDKPEILGDVDRALAGEEFSALREVNSRTFEMWYSPLRASTGEVFGAIGVATDVTERKRAEERLREANRRLEDLAVLRADFTAMVAHELGTPLAVVRGYADVLDMDELKPAERSRALAQIRAQTDVLNALVADVRTAAAIERDDFTVEPRQVSVSELLDDAAQFAGTLPGDRPFSTKVAVEEQVLVDPYRIGQVLRNLLSNAAKYSPDGTPIELRAVPGESPGRVRIEVADRGHGVHPDDVERIFEKFGRGRDRSGRKVVGVGLGLYLSRRILRTHGSELTFRPAPGGGSVFFFELEVAR